MVILERHDQVNAELDQLLAAAAARPASDAAVTPRRPPRRRRGGRRPCTRSSTTAFGDRPPLDPPADALAETAASRRRRARDGGGLLATLDGDPSARWCSTPVGDRLALRRFGVVPAAQRPRRRRRLVPAAEARVGRRRRGSPCVAREELPATSPSGAATGSSRPAGARRTSSCSPLPRLTRVPDADAMRELGAGWPACCAPATWWSSPASWAPGKTTFTQGLGAGLGVRGDVTSPTFVIARVHPSLVGGPALVHVDAYRLGGIDELDDLDLDTSLDEAVTVVEWGDGHRRAAGRRPPRGAAAAAVDGRDRRPSDDAATSTLAPSGALGALGLRLRPS